MGNRGILLRVVNDFDVLDNEIHGIVVNSAVAASGISIYSNASNGTIARNRISDIVQNNSGGAAYGIYLGSTSFASNPDFTE